MATKREVELLFKARDEATREVSNLRKELGRLEEQEKRREARRKSFRLGDTEQAALRVLSVVGQLRVGVDAANIATAAMAGEWDQMRDRVFRLPFGIGEVSRGLYELLGAVTGINREIDGLNQRMAIAQDHFDAIHSAKGARINLQSQFDDHIRQVQRRTRLAVASPERRRELSIEFAREDAIARVGQIQGHAQREIDRLRVLRNREDDRTMELRKQRAVATSLAVNSERLGMQGTRWHEQIETLTEEINQSMARAISLSKEMQRLNEDVIEAADTARTTVRSEFRRQMEAERRSVLDASRSTTPMPRQPLTGYESRFLTRPQGRVTDDSAEKTKENTQKTANATQKQVTLLQEVVREMTSWREHGLFNVRESNLGAHNS